MSKTNMGIHGVTSINVTSTSTELSAGEHVNRITIVHGDAVTEVFAFSEEPLTIAVCGNVDEETDNG